MFITIYGVNNMGKSTHAQLLVENLQRMGKEAVYVKFPVYKEHPTGPYLDSALRAPKQVISEEELQLWFVLNRHQFQDSLKAYLDKGVIVVAEDYIGTGIAWGWAKGCDIDWLKEMNRFLIKEDLSILITGERAMHAVEPEHIHETDDEMINLVRKHLLILAEERKWQRVELQPAKHQTQKLILDVVKKHIS